MYIPLMALVTYILLSTTLAGLRGAFQPELLGSNFGWAFFIMIIEILGLKLGCYLLSISNESQLLDLVAYSGYKFVGVISTLVVSEVFNGGKGTGGWVGWTVFTYTFMANALFLVSSTHNSMNLQTANITPVTVSEIRPASREHDRRKRNHANSRTITKEPKNPISLLILIPCTIDLHVGAHQAMSFAMGWERQCTGVWNGQDGESLSKMRGLHREALWQTVGEI
jgi:hypothetical protein